MDGAINVRGDSAATKAPDSISISSTGGATVFEQQQPQQSSGSMRGPLGGNDGSVYTPRPPASTITAHQRTASVSTTGGLSPTAMPSWTLPSDPNSDKNYDPFLVSPTAAAAGEPPVLHLSQANAAWQSPKTYNNSILCRVCQRMVPRVAWQEHQQTVQHHRRLQECAIAYHNNADEATPQSVIHEPGLRQAPQSSFPSLIAQRQSGTQEKDSRNHANSPQLPFLRPDDAAQIRHSVVPTMPLNRRPLQELSAASTAGAAAGGPSFYFNGTHPRDISATSSMRVSPMMMDATDIQTGVVEVHYVELTAEQKARQRSMQLSKLEDNYITSTEHRLLRHCLHHWQRRSIYHAFRTAANRREAGADVGARPEAAATAVAAVAPVERWGASPDSRMLDDHSQQRYPLGGTRRPSPSIPQDATTTTTTITTTTTTAVAAPADEEEGEAGTGAAVDALRHSSLPSTALPTQETALAMSEKRWASRGGSVQTFDKLNDATPTHDLTQTWTQDRSYHHRDGHHPTNSPPPICTTRMKSYEQVRIRQPYNDRDGGVLFEKNLRELEQAETKVSWYVETPKYDNGESSASASLHGEEGSGWNDIHQHGAVGVAGEGHLARHPTTTFANGGDPVQQQQRRQHRRRTRIQRQHYSRDDGSTHHGPHQQQHHRPPHYRGRNDQASKEEVIPTTPSYPHRSERDDRQRGSTAPPSLPTKIRPKKEDAEAYPRVSSKGRRDSLGQYAAEEVATDTFSSSLEGSVMAASYESSGTSADPLYDCGAEVEELLQRLSPDTQRRVRVALAAQTPRHGRGRRRSSISSEKTTTTSDDRSAARCTNASIANGKESDNAGRVGDTNSYRHSRSPVRSHAQHQTFPKTLLALENMRLKAALHRQLTASSRCPSPGLPVAEESGEACRGTSSLGTTSTTIAIATGAAASTPPRHCGNGSGRSPCDGAPVTDDDFAGVLGVLSGVLSGIDRANTSSVRDNVISAADGKGSDFLPTPREKEATVSPPTGPGIGAAETVPLSVCMETQTAVLHHAVAAAILNSTSTSASDASGAVASGTPPSVGEESAGAVAVEPPKPPRCSDDTRVSTEYGGVTLRGQTVATPPLIVGGPSARGPASLPIAGTPVTAAGLHLHDRSERLPHSQLPTRGSGGSASQRVDGGSRPSPLGIAPHPAASPGPSRSFRTDDEAVGPAASGLSWPHRRGEVSEEDGGVPSIAIPQLSQLHQGFPHPSPSRPSRSLALVAKGVGLSRISEQPSLRSGAHVGDQTSHLTSRGDGDAELVESCASPHGQLHAELSPCAALHRHGTSQDGSATTRGMRALHRLATIENGAELPCSRAPHPYYDAPVKSSYVELSQFANRTAASHPASIEALDAENFFGPPRIPHRPADPPTKRAGVADAGAEGMGDRIEASNIARATSEQREEPVAPGPQIRSRYRHRRRRSHHRRPVAKEDDSEGSPGDAAKGVRESALDCGERWEKMDSKVEADFRDQRPLPCRGGGRRDSYLSREDGEPNLVHDSDEVAASRELHRPHRHDSGDDRVQPREGHRFSSAPGHIYLQGAARRRAPVASMMNSYDARCSGSAAPMRAASASTIGPNRPTSPARRMRDDSRSPWLPTPSKSSNLRQEYQTPSFSIHATPGELYYRDHENRFHVVPEEYLRDVAEGRRSRPQQPLYIVHAPPSPPPSGFGLPSMRRSPRRCTAARNPLGCSRLNVYCSTCRERFHLVYVNEKLQPLRWPSPRSRTIEQLGDCRYHSGMVFGDSCEVLKGRAPSMEKQWPSIGETTGSAFPSDDPLLRSERERRGRPQHRLPPPPSGGFVPISYSAGTSRLRCVDGSAASLPMANYHEPAFDVQRRSSTAAAAAAAAQPLVQGLSSSVVRRSGQSGSGCAATPTPSSIPRQSSRVTAWEDHDDGPSASFAGEGCQRLQPTSHDAALAEEAMQMMGTPTAPSRGSAATQPRYRDPSLDGPAFDAAALPSRPVKGAAEKHPPSLSIPAAPSPTKEEARCAWHELLRREERRIKRSIKQLLWREMPDRRGSAEWEASVMSLSEGLGQRLRPRKDA